MSPASSERQERLEEIRKDVHFLRSDLVNSVDRLIVSVDTLTRTIDTTSRSQIDIFNALRNSVPIKMVFILMGIICLAFIGGTFLRDFSSAGLAKTIIGVMG